MYPGSPGADGGEKRGSVRSEVSGEGQPVASSDAVTRKERSYVDRFGFLLNTSAAQPIPQDRAREHQATDQWIRMLCDWPRAVADYPTIRRRTRRGLPPSLRGLIWQLLLGSRALKMRHPGLYASLLEREMDKGLCEIAKRDLSRTFPTHALFLGADGIGQRQLFRVLRAFAVYDPRVGYCQGMGFIAATLLTQMGEEDAFWAFVVLMKSAKYDLAGLYLPGFPRLQRAFEQFRLLLKRYCKPIAEHLTREGVDVSFFASQWFMTLFVYQFPFPLLLPVWDLFIVDGWKGIMRVALELLETEKEGLLRRRMESLLPFLKQLHEGKEGIKLVQGGFRFKVTNRRLDQLA